MSSFAMRCSAFLFAILLFALTMATASAQSVTGSVSGFVTDSSGGVIVGASVTLSNDAKSAVTLQCEQRAHDVQGSDGTSWYMKCPAGCTTNSSVWGTDLYTDDSQVCGAAIHAQTSPPAVAGAGPKSRSVCRLARPPSLRRKNSRGRSGQISSPGNHRTSGRTV